MTILWTQWWLYDCYDVIQWLYRSNKGQTVKQVTCSIYPALKRFSSWLVHLLVLVVVVVMDQLLICWLKLWTIPMFWRSKGHKWFNLRSLFQFFHWFFLAVYIIKTNNTKTINIYIKTKILQIIKLLQRRYAILLDPIVLKKVSSYRCYSIPARICCILTVTKLYGQ